MPVEPHVLDQPGSLGVQPDGQQQHEGDQADQDMQGMKSGQEEIGAGPHVTIGDVHRQMELVLIIPTLNMAAVLRMAMFTPERFTGLELVDLFF